MKNLTKNETYLKSMTIFEILDHERANVNICILTVDIEIGEAVTLFFVLNDR